MENLQRLAFHQLLAHPGHTLLAFAAAWSGFNVEIHHGNSLT
jgi:hypothetical protein